MTWKEDKERQVQRRNTIEKEKQLVRDVHDIFWGDMPPTKPEENEDADADRLRPNSHSAARSSGGVC